MSTQAAWQLHSHPRPPLPALTLPSLLGGPYSSYPSDWLTERAKQQIADASDEPWECCICTHLPIRPVHHVRLLRLNLEHKENDPPPPVQCSAIFCRSCLEQWLELCASTRNQMGPHCPNCRMYVDVAAIQPHYQQIHIDRLEVACRFHKHGCLWRGPVGRDASNLLRHMQIECEFRPVPCRFNASHLEHLEHRQLEHEREECSSRLVRCRDCSLDYVFEQEDEHRETKCTKPVECPNQCFAFFSAFAHQQGGSFEDMQALFLTDESKACTFDVWLDTNTDAGCEWLPDCTSARFRNFWRLSDKEKQTTAIKETDVSLSSSTTTPPTSISVEPDPATKRILVHETHAPSKGELRSSIPLCDLNRHLDHDCPRSLAACPYAELGCQAKVARCLLLFHLEWCAETHTSLFRNAKLAILKKPKRSNFGKRHAVRGRWYGRSGSRRRSERLASPNNIQSGGGSEQRYEAVVISLLSSESDEDEQH